MTGLIFPPLRIPRAVHLLPAGWIAFFVLLAETRPLAYDGLLQEDRFVEWLTVGLFGAAAWFALSRAVHRRRVFDGLVGAFCVFVAGEEFSWGQRLLGLTPPDAFLEHNRQQELTVHNFASVFGEPKWILILALVGFGLVLPLVGRAARGRQLLERVGATPPNGALVPWFAVAIALLAWYPYSFTGEWVEALAGACFLLAFMPSLRAAAIAGGIAAVLAFALAWVSGRAVGVSPAQLACAQAEIDALVEDIARGAGATGRLIGATSVHKRVFTAVEEGYVRHDRLASFARVRCPGDGDAADRRRHVIDPWGTAYWLRLDRDPGRIDFEVYSFGPNRRRDPDGGDDIVSHLQVTPLADPSAAARTPPSDVTNGAGGASSGENP